MPNLLSWDMNDKIQFQISFTYWALRLSLISFYSVMQKYITKILCKSQQWPTNSFTSLTLGQWWNQLRFLKSLSFQPCSLPPLCLFFFFFFSSAVIQTEIWLWSTQMATNAPLASREWPSSTLSATRTHVRLSSHDPHYFLLTAFSALCSKPH